MRTSEFNNSAIAQQKEDSLKSKLFMTVLGTSMIVACFVLMIKAIH